VITNIAMMENLNTRHGSKIARFSTLALLYFVQGAPYGFQTACLPLILRKSGLSFSSLGAMKLLFLPWVCKPLYAPLIERTKSKLWWLLASMSVLGLTCFYAATFTSESMLGALSIILLLLNLASATQDICVDSLALKILRQEELGAGNTIQVVAYKAGSVFAGGSLLWVRDLTSWSMMWTLFGCLYLTCICLVYGLHLVDDDPPVVGEGQPLNPVKESLKNIFKVEGTWWMVGFVLFYKLCERGEGTLPIYLVDKGVPMSKLAFWTGVVRSAASLTGSSVGGYLLSANRSKPRTVLYKTAMLRCFPIFIQLFVITVWGIKPLVSADSLNVACMDSLMFYTAIISLCLANFCAGMLTTACFTAMMTLSQSAPESIQSSHYSLLATMEVLGKLAFASVSGWIIDIWGLNIVFVIFVILAFLTVPVLWAMPSSSGDTKKYRS